MNIRHRPFLCLAVVAAIVVTALLFTHHYHRQQVEHSKALVEKTRHVIDEAQLFNNAFQQTLISQRAYLFSGHEEYLNTYKQHLRALPGHIDRLKAMAPHSSTKSNIQTIETNLRSLITLVDEKIVDRQHGEIVESFKSSERTFALAVNVQNALSQFIAEERALLRTRTVAEREKYEQYIQVMLWASLASIIAMVGVSVLLFLLQSRQFDVERELKETKERLDLAIWGASAGVWDWNVQSDAIYLSPRLKEIAGYTDEDVPDTVNEFHTLLHPEDRTQVMRRAQAYLNKEIDAYETVFRIQHKKGGWRWILSRGRALWDKHDKPYRMIGVHTDITTQKELEDKLHEARQKAEASSEAKSAFLANMSHEIRNPMNIIIGIASLLAKHQSLSPEVKEYADALQSGANTLHGLLNDILDFSKLESGMMTLDRSQFNLKTVLTESINLAAFRAREKHLALETDIPASLPNTFIGDPLRVRQIVNNLLSNAVKFTEQGSVKLSVTAAPDSTGKRCNVTIRVKDTGIGIAEDKLGMIFEKFIQTDPLAARRSSGTGLGLAICKELTELMGGKIYVTSTKDQGSEFIVRLPLEVAVEKQLVSPAKPAKSRESKNAIRGTVLLVEDYKPNVLVIRTVLTDLGYECKAIHTAEDAISLLCSDSRKQFYAVLMDVQLPDLNGFEATRYIRAYEKAYHLPPIPIIAMTAHALMGDRDKCLDSGMDEYIAKPFDTEDLAEKLAKVVDFSLSSLERAS